jgi:hypothetical protein
MRHSLYSPQRTAAKPRRIALRQTGSRVLIELSADIWARNDLRPVSGTRAIPRTETPKTFFSSWVRVYEVTAYACLPTTWEKNELRPDAFPTQSTAVHCTHAGPQNNLRRGCDLQIICDREHKARSAIDYGYRGGGFNVSTIDRLISPDHNVFWGRRVDTTSASLA